MYRTVHSCVPYSTVHLLCILLSGNVFHVPCMTALLFNKQRLQVHLAPVHFRAILTYLYNWHFFTLNLPPIFIFVTWPKVR